MFGTDEYRGIITTADLTTSPTRRGWECTRCGKTRSGSWTMSRATRAGERHELIRHWRELRAEADR